MRKPATPTPRLRSEDRQREVVAAVLALAAEHGPDAITTQAIADRIGVTQGALFRHFPNKEAIWLAVIGWTRESILAVFEQSVSKVSTPLARLEAAFLAHVGFIAANPGVPRVMFHELQYPGDSPVRAAVRTLIGEYSARLGSLFEQARRSGDISPDLDAKLAPLLFIGAVQALVIQGSLSGDNSGIGKRARRVFPLLLNGYRGRKAS